MDNIRKLWNEVCLQADIPAISVDTAARIMAVIYVHGNNEAFVYNKKFLADVDYIKERFQIYGTGVPPIEFVTLTKQYTKELEDYYYLHKNDKTESGAFFHNPAPQWAHKLFMERYGIKLIN